ASMVEPMHSARQEDAEDGVQFVFAELFAGLDNSDQFVPHGSQEQWCESFASSSPPVAQEQWCDSLASSSLPVVQDPALALTCTLTSTRSRVASTEVPSPRVYSAYETSP
ncbi:unnamed protein product, partial [Symbiodinium natans]